MYFRSVTGPHFKTMHANSKTTSLVPTNPVFKHNTTLPLASPDGKWSASLGKREWTDPKKSGAIVIKNLQTQAEHMYLIDGDGYFIDERSLGWNADSKRLIFTEHRVPNNSVKQERMIDVVAETQSTFCDFPSGIAVAEPGGKWYQGNRMVLVDDWSTNHDNGIASLIAFMGDKALDKGLADQLLVTKPNSCEIDYQIPIPSVHKDQESELKVAVDETGNALLITQYLHDMTSPEPGLDKTELT